LIKERDQKSKGKGKQRGSENIFDNNETEGEIGESSDNSEDRMEVDGEDERKDSEKTAKVCLSFYVLSHY
jgi:hypothetical protein